MHKSHTGASDPISPLCCRTAAMPLIWLAYQLKAGIDYRIHKYVSMRIGYRYFGATTISEVVTPSPISESNFSCNGSLSTRGVEVGIILDYTHRQNCSG